MFAKTIMEMDFSGNWGLKINKKTGVVLSKNQDYGTIVYRFFISDCPNHKKKK